MDKPLLKISNLRKSFNGIEVLHSVDLQVRAGEIVALVGENGAGKSTLMKILMGEYSSDGGSIELEGREVHFSSPHQALESGISMIFQEMSPFPNLTVAENIYVGREPHKYGFLNPKAQNEKAKMLLEMLGINLDIYKKVRDLTVSEMQLLEIAKAVSYHSKIVIMDEPTSALTDSEVQLLFRAIARLKKQGVSIIYISHKMEELYEIADTICVLRDGCMISSRPIADVKQEVIISEMVGRKLEQMYPELEKKIGEVIFRVEDLKQKGVFENISFELRRGEVLGIAGMVGSGRTELLSSMFGIERYHEGSIYIDEKEVEIRSPEDAIKNHMALVPEDRGRCGLNLLGSIRMNMCMTILDKISRWKGIFANPNVEKENTGSMSEKMHIKMNDQEQSVHSLSGGNQQKVVVGKWLLTEPDIIFLDEPTRGIDVGAKYEIYEMILQLAKQGKAIIMVSSEMPELLGICDRIMVLREGRIAGEFESSEATQEKIMASIVNSRAKGMECDK